jgi:hypothetical protein
MNDFDSDFEESEELADKIWNFSIKWGFGIEHFFNDHFSVISAF